MCKRIDTALSQVANWERIRKFLVLPQPFSVAAEELARQVAGNNFRVVVAVLKVL